MKCERHRQKFPFSPSITSLSLSCKFFQMRLFFVLSFCVIITTGSVLEGCCPGASSFVYDTQGIGGLYLGPTLGNIYNSSSYTFAVWVKLVAKQNQGYVTIMQKTPYTTYSHSGSWALRWSNENSRLELDLLLGVAII